MSQKVTFLLILSICLVTLQACKDGEKPSIENANQTKNENESKNPEEVDEKNLNPEEIDPYTDKQWDKLSESERSKHPPGVQLIGKCTNDGCDGSQKSYVVCNQLGYGDLYVIKDSKLQVECKCPDCNSLVDPTSFSVNNCWYRVIYVREGAQVKNITPWEKIGDKCRVYNQGEEVSIQGLKIECKRLDDEPAEKKDF